MRNVLLPVLIAFMLSACGQTKNNQDRAVQSTTDSVSAASPKPRNCQSIVKAGKLGKTDDYQESAKPIKVSLTLNQDTSSVDGSGKCYFNNTITVQATKKAGKQLFKRTLLKDDLLYFTKSDEAIEQAILQTVIYKPTFNSQKYITLTMRLIDPTSQKTLDYQVTMNYFGEIIKVN